MRLRTEDGTVIDSPSGRDVARIAGTLGAPDNTFAVLESDSGFVQVLATENGYILQQGHDGELRELKDSGGGSLPKDAVIDAMRRFAEDRPDWDRGLNPSVDDAFGEPLGLATKVIAVITALLFCATLALGFLV